MDAFSLYFGVVWFALICRTRAHWDSDGRALFPNRIACQPREVYVIDATCQWRRAIDEVFWGELASSLFARRWRVGRDLWSHRYRSLAADAEVRISLEHTRWRCCCKLLVPQSVIQWAMGRSDLRCIDKIISRGRCSCTLRVCKWIMNGANSVCFVFIVMRYRQYIDESRRIAVTSITRMIRGLVIDLIDRSWRRCDAGGKDAGGRSLDDDNVATNEVGHLTRSFRSDEKQRS